MSLALLGALASPAMAKTKLSVGYPAAPTAGQTLVVKVGARGTVKGTLQLQQKSGRKWTKRATSKLKHGVGTLSWRAPSTTTITLRVQLLNHKHVLATSGSKTLRLSAAPGSPVVAQTGGGASPALPDPVAVMASPAASAPDPSTGTAQPDRSTTISSGAYSITVPAGVVSAPSPVTVTPMSSDGDDLTGPSAEFHIDADWEDGTKTVRITLPIDPALADLGDGYAPVAIHYLSDGTEQIVSGDQLDVDTTNGTISFDTTSLSVARATELPGEALGLLKRGASKATDYALAQARHFTGLHADTPECSPDSTHDTSIATSGTALDNQSQLGAQPPVKYCVTVTNGVATWNLANNTGAVLEFTAQDDATVVGEATPAGDLLNEIAFSKRNTLATDEHGNPIWANQVDIPPGSSVRVTSDHGDANPVSISASPALSLSAFVLRQAGALVSSEADAKKLYDALTGCGYPLAISSWHDAANLLSCARSVPGILDSALKKKLDIAFFVVDAGIATADVTGLTVDPVDLQLSYMPRTSGGSDEPSFHDRPAADIPLIDGALWNEPMGDGGQILARADGAVTTTRGTGSGTESADIPFALQAVGNDGSMLWRRSSDTVNEGAYSYTGSVTDAESNTYFLVTDQAGDYIRSVDPSGNVRWTSSLLPDNASVITYTRPFIGADGKVYFDLYNPYATNERLFGIKRTTGQLMSDIPVQGLAFGSTADGLVSADYGGGVTYYDNQGASTYIPEGIYTNSAALAVGAQRTVFFAGQLGDDDPNNRPLSVSKTTVDGVAWTYTSDLADANGRLSAAALPNGGVVVVSSDSTQLDRVTALDSSGHLLWRKDYPPDEDGNGAQVQPPIVDAAGRIVLIHTITTDGIPVARADFLNQADGSSALPAVSLQDVHAHDDDPIGTGAIGSAEIAPDRLYVSAAAGFPDAASYTSRADSLAAVAVPGLKANYLNTLATANG